MEYNLKSSHLGAHIFVRVISFFAIWPPSI
jgi:hypothetical protein